ELLKYLFWIWHLRVLPAAAFGSARTGLSTSTCLRVRAAFCMRTGLSAGFFVRGAHLLHFFASFRALLLVELAVLVRIKFLEHAFAHFGPLVAPFLAVLFRGLGDSRECQNAGCYQCETWDETSHRHYSSVRIPGVTRRNRCAPH